MFVKLSGRARPLVQTSEHHKCRFCHLNQKFQSHSPCFKMLIHLCLPTFTLISHCDVLESVSLKLFSPRIWMFGDLLKGTDHVYVKDKTSEKAIDLIYKFSGLWRSHKYIRSTVKPAQTISFCKVAWPYQELKCQRSNWLLFIPVSTGN